MEIFPVRLIVRIGLRRLAAVESERKLVQLCRAKNAGVPHRNDRLVGPLSDRGGQTGDRINEIVFGAVYVVSHRQGPFALTGELMVNLHGSEVFIGQIATGTGNARQSVQQT